jgi:hypothetical protein
MVTVRMGNVPPVKPGHPGTAVLLTVATMRPVTMAPDEDRLPALLFVCTVAETRAPPQVAVGTGAICPVASTVTKSGVFETQVTWSVISFVTTG